MTMRFMVIIKADADSEAGKAPSAELAAIGRYNDQMVKAGVMRTRQRVARGAAA
jgi:hypothetical protein